MTGLLLDTHVWLWYVAGSKRLPPKLKRHIERNAASCWLSPISVWELGGLMERGRVRIGTDLRSWLRAALAAFPLQEAQLTNEVAMRSRELALGHRDPADHLLAATALVHGLTLATQDENLSAVSWLPTVSG